MDPQSFRFSVKLPADRRLVGAVRDLTAHAASYAKLSSDACRSLADHVVSATESTIATIYAAGAPIKVRFKGSSDGVEVDITSEPEPSSQTPRSSQAGQTDVNWSREGSRQTCHIRQRRSP